MAYVRIPPYDQSGCLVTDNNSISSGGNLDRFNIIAEISVLNTGTEIFIPPTSFVGTADCFKTAIYDFYQLDFPGGPYSRHATCLTDDSYYATAKQNGASTCSESLTKSGIKQGGGYGLLRKVTVKFPMSATQFMALNGTGSGTAVTVKLSVNPSITDGSPDTITLLNVTDTLGNIEWKKDGIFHSAINIYTAPTPTREPTVAPISSGPTIEPTFLEPTGAPSSMQPSDTSSTPTATPSSCELSYSGTAVPASAKLNNKDLTSVCIYATVQTIGDSAFSGCSSLVS
eukprot:gene32508-42114_t